MGISRKELKKELEEAQRKERDVFHDKWVSRIKLDMMKNETENQRKLRLLLSVMFGDKYKIRTVHYMRDNNGNAVFVRNFIGGKQLIVEVANVVSKKKLLVMATHGCWHISVKPSILNDQEQLDKKMDEIRLCLENPKVYRKTVCEYKKRNERQTTTSTPFQKRKEKEALVLNSMRENGRSCDNCNWCIGKRGFMGVCIVHKRDIPLDSICVRHKKDKS